MLAFMPIFASATPPRAQQSSACSRRQFLTLALSLPVTAALPAQAKDAFGVGDALPSEKFGEISARVKGDVTMDKFVQAVNGGSVKVVWFFGAQNEYCCFENSDGDVFHIGEGYPQENPRSNESPLQIVGRVRNLGIPYYIAPVSGQFVKR